MFLHCSVVFRHSFGAHANLQLSSAFHLFRNSCLTREEAGRVEETRDTASMFPRFVDPVQRGRDQFKRPMSSAPMTRRPIAPVRSEARSSFFVFLGL